MTSKELYEKLIPADEKHYVGQLLDNGLSVNLSDMFSRFVKDAARCNGYNSDIYYDMKHIDEAMHEFDPDKEFEPIWVAFRKLGVDGTAYVLCRAEENNLYSSICDNYFALYCVTVEHNSYDFYSVVLREYPV